MLIVLRIVEQISFFPFLIAHLIPQIGVKQIAISKWGLATNLWAWVAIHNWLSGIFQWYLCDTVGHLQITYASFSKRGL